MHYLDLKSIDPSKECLKFLELRISLDNYRGLQVSQHNRYTENNVFEMLRALYDLVENDFMQIRTTDLSKRPFNIAGEECYAKYVDLVRKKVGRGTQDSIRKNHFVDINRMGLLDRYTNEKVKIMPYEHSSTKYVKLSKLGEQYVMAEDLFTRRMIFSKALNTLFHGYMDVFIEITSELKTLSIYEYMFFVSFINLSVDGTVITQEKVIELVKEYRTLPKFSKEVVIERVREYCNPNKFKGDKKQKRDFDNWKNEAQQTFSLLNQTVYFDNKGEDLVLRIGKDAIDETDEIRLKRSETAKKEYFEYHSVQKKSGFELHHVVALCSASSREEYYLLDNYKNLVYIDGYSHARITQNANKNKVLGVLDDGTVTFTSPLDDTIECKKDLNILYDPINKTEMISYNEQLLNGIS